VSENGDHPAVITAEQLAERLQVSVSHIHQMAKDGKIPSLRIGRARRFEFERVVAALREAAIA
jgi:excisionase family DNA binding protein